SWPMASIDREPGEPCKMRSGVPAFITPHAACQRTAIAVTKHRSRPVCERPLEEKHAGFSRANPGVAEPEGAVEGLCGRHVGQRVKTDALIAEPARLGHDRQRQLASEPAAPLPRTHVKTLHFAKIAPAQHRPQGDAA